MNEKDEKKAVPAPLAAKVAGTIRDAIQDGRFRCPCGAPLTIVGDFEEVICPRGDSYWNLGE